MNNWSLGDILDFLLSESKHLFKEMMFERIRMGQIKKMEREQHILDGSDSTTFNELQTPIKLEPKFGNDYIAKINVHARAIIGCQPANRQRPTICSLIVEYLQSEDITDRDNGNVEFLLDETDEIREEYSILAAQGTTLPNIYPAQHTEPEQQLHRQIKWNIFIKIN